MRSSLSRRLLLGSALAPALYALGGCSSDDSGPAPTVDSSSGPSSSAPGTPAPGTLGSGVSAPAVLAEVPAAYAEESAQPGRVVRIDYRSSTHDSENRPLQKYAYAYLPYGYDQADVDTRYDVFYVLHGGGGSPENYFDGEGQSSRFQRILDHTMESGQLRPLIVVAPTFYPDAGTDSSVATAGTLTANFHQEVAQDLLPAVETELNTYADTTDPEGLRASRAHRAFGGFSMGSVTTWYQFIHNLDLFAYFMPLSGDSWVIEEQGGGSEPRATAAALDEAARASGYSPRDYLIYALTGSDDIAYPPMNPQNEAIKSLTASFTYDADFIRGNLYFSVLPGGTHNTNPYVFRYIFNALPTFFQTVA